MWEFVFFLLFFFFSFKAFSPPSFFSLSNVLSKVNKNLSFLPPRMSRSSGRSRSTASPAAARPSPSFTCWGNCMWPTRATAGAFYGRRLNKLKQVHLSALRIFSSLSFEARSACFLKYTVANTFTRPQGHHHQEQRDHPHVDGVHAGIRATATSVPGK